MFLNIRGYIFINMYNYILIYKKISISKQRSCIKNAKALIIQGNNICERFVEMLVWEKQQQKHLSYIQNYTSQFKLIWK